MEISSNITWQPGTFSLSLNRNLREDIHDKLPKAIAGNVRSLGELWLPRSRSQYGTNAQAFVNRVLHGRRYAWYNPDGHALLGLYDQLPMTERNKVPRLRKEAWGWQQLTENLGYYCVF